MPRRSSRARPWRRALARGGQGASVTSTRPRCEEGVAAVRLALRHVARAVGARCQLDFVAPCVVSRLVRSSGRGRRGRDARGSRPLRTASVDRPRRSSQCLRGRARRHTRRFSRGSPRRQPTLTSCRSRSSASRGSRAGWCSTRPGGQGFRVRLVGRLGEALKALARADEEVRVADARDDASLRAAFVGIDVVASVAGPFLELGLLSGAGGSRGRGALPRYEWRAAMGQARPRAGSGGDGRAAGVRLRLRPGDLAARLAAEKVEGPLDEVVVAYSVKGVGTSRGTLCTIGRRAGSDAGGMAGRTARPVLVRSDDAHHSLPVR